MKRFGLKATANIKKGNIMVKLLSLQFENRLVICTRRSGISPEEVKHIVDIANEFDKKKFEIMMKKMQIRSFILENIGVSECIHLMTIKNENNPTGN